VKEHKQEITATSEPVQQATGNRQRTFNMRTRGYFISNGHKLDFLILALFATVLVPLYIPTAECLINCGRNLNSPAVRVSQQLSASAVTTLHRGHHRERCWQSNTSNSNKHKHILVLFANKKESLDDAAALKEEDNDAEAILYNDDAFGLVFLSGVLVAHDPIFSSVFLFVSAIVATIINTNVGADVGVGVGDVPPENNKAQRAWVVNLLPGFVALAALTIQAILLSPQNEKLHGRLMQMLSERGLDLGVGAGASLSTNGLALEVGVCVISFVWAFYRSTKSLSDTTRTRT